MVFHAGRGNELRSTLSISQKPTLIQLAFSLPGCGFTSGTVKDHVEPAPPSFGVLHTDTPAVSNGDFLGDGQAQAGAGVGLARYAKKAIKDQSSIFFRHAWPLI